LGFAVAAGVMALALSGTVRAAEEFKETPIGEAKIVNGLKIAAVYLDPIEMEPHGVDMPASKADIHLEADIHAEKENPNGFGAGEWVPYLTVTYRLQNTDTGKVLSGKFMPMVAKDGPHYGANVKMPGAGNYKLTYTIDNPEKQSFGRHTDQETGVGKWFKSFDVSYEFKYVPPKK
jgi:periplasmic iron binding protein